MLVEGDASAALDVAPADCDIRTVALASPGLAGSPAICAGVHSNDCCCALSRGLLQLTSSLLSAVYGYCCQRTGRKVRPPRGPVIHPAEFQIRLDVIVQVIVRQEAGLVALVLALQVFVIG